jgi:hypothetical protein
LHDRLRRLEHFIQTLGTPMPADGTLKNRIDLKTLAAGPAESGAELEETKEILGQADEVDDISNRFGSLIITEDSSRYISPGLWTHLNHEVCIANMLFVLANFAWRLTISKIF